jgi:hypothetical protein
MRDPGEQIFRKAQYSQRSRAAVMPLPTSNDVQRRVMAVYGNFTAHFAPLGSLGRYLKKRAS